MVQQKRQAIMLVDDNPAILNMGKNILKDHYEVYALPSAERLFKFLESVTPDLILLDVLMPNMSGFEIIRILKSNAQYAQIPVIFVTSKIEENDELEGLALGAVDYVAKPFAPAILLKRIENQLLIKSQQEELKDINDSLAEMVKEKVGQVFGLQNSIVSTVAEVVEFRDNFTGGHIARTQNYVEILIKYLIEHDIYSDDILAWEDVEHIVSSTQLHDLGKVFISDTILNKPGKLTPEEFEIMKTHVIKGVEAIRTMQKNDDGQVFLKHAEIVAGTHHEKWDGTGYPNGLKGADIPLLGRLMAIADVYDALISKRSYKPSIGAEKSTAIIIEGSGSHFDPVLVDVFKEVSEEFAEVAKSHASDELAEVEKSLAAV